MGRIPPSIADTHTYKTLPWLPIACSTKSKLVSMPCKAFGDPAPVSTRPPPRHCTPRPPGHQPVRLSGFRNLPCIFTPPDLRSCSFSAYYTFPLPPPSPSPRSRLKGTCSIKHPWFLNSECIGPSSGLHFCGACFILRRVTHWVGTH